VHIRHAPAHCRGADGGTSWESHYNALADRWARWAADHQQEKDLAIADCDRYQGA
jgi:hypothetical protein